MTKQQRFPGRANSWGGDTATEQTLPEPGSALVPSSQLWLPEQFLVGFFFLSI